MQKFLKEHRFLLSSLLLFVHLKLESRFYRLTQWSSWLKVHWLTSSSWSYKCKIATPEATKFEFCHADIKEWPYQGHINKLFYTLASWNSIFNKLFVNFHFSFWSKCAYEWPQQHTEIIFSLIVQLYQQHAQYARFRSFYKIKRTSHYRAFLVWFEFKYLKKCNLYHSLSNLLIEV